MFDERKHCVEYAAILNVLLEEATQVMQITAQARPRELWRIVRRKRDLVDAVNAACFSAGRIFSFAWSPAGRWLSFGRGASRSDVVLMSNEP